jgi:hypothetical protein
VCVYRGMREEVMKKKKPVTLVTPELETLEDLMSRLPDRSDLDGALSCAETCENMKDFAANVDDAIEQAKILLDGLVELRGEIVE